MWSWLSTGFSVINLVYSEASVCSYTSDSGALVILICKSCNIIPYKGLFRRCTSSPLEALVSHNIELFFSLHPSFPRLQFLVPALTTLSCLLVLFTSCDVFTPVCSLQFFSILNTLNGSIKLSREYEHCIEHCKFGSISFRNTFEPSKCSRTGFATDEWCL